MNAIRIIRTIDSETLTLPELRPFVGKRVEIVVSQEVEIEDRREPLMDAAGRGLIDPEANEQGREYDRLQAIAPEIREDIPPGAGSDRYEEFFALAGQDIVDFEAYKQLREADSP